MAYYLIRHLVYVVAVFVFGMVIQKSLSGQPKKRTPTEPTFCDRCGIHLTWWDAIHRRCDYCRQRYGPRS